MTLPAIINVTLDFNSGPIFGLPFTVGDPVAGRFGYGTFSGSETPEKVVDLSDVTRQITITRGRNVQRDTYEAGVCTVKIIDPDSYFSPQNTASPYYPNVIPLRKLRISATADGVTNWLFSGYTTDYQYSYDQTEQMGYVSIVCADAFRLFQMAQVADVTGQAAGQTTGTRINKILDTMSFPLNMRKISTGSTTCQADPAYSRSGLNALKNCEFTEQGAFYCDTAGAAVFKSRDEVVGSLAQTPIQFNQTGGIPYQNLKFAFDDKLIINKGDFTRYGTGAITQTIINQPSIDRYFPHGNVETDLIAETDAQVNDIVRIYVATRAETTIRIDAMTVNLQDPTVPTNTMLNLDYFSNLKISNQQPDGSTLVKTLQCQGLEWNITPNSMIVTVTTLEPIVEGFIVGNSNYGIIGQSIMSY
jgi:hypothetical protein